MRVIKRGGQRATEDFSIDKLHQSVQAACLSVRTFEGEAAGAAKYVTDKVLEWSHAKHTVTSHDIRRVAALHLERFHPEAAYIYQNHQLVV